MEGLAFLEVEVPGWEVLDVEVHHVEVLGVEGGLVEVHVVVVVHHVVGPDWEGVLHVEEDLHEVVVLLDVVEVVLWEEVLGLVVGLGVLVVALWVEVRLYL